MSNFSGPFTSKVDAYQGMLVFGYDYFRYINVSKYQTSKLNHQPPLWLIPSKESLIWDSPPLQNTRLKDMNGVDAEEGQTLLEHVSQQKFNNKKIYNRKMVLLLFFNWKFVRFYWVFATLGEHMS